MNNSFRDGTLRPALAGLFNDEPDLSRSFLNSHLELHPQDPLAHALLAAVNFYDRVIGWMLSRGKVTTVGLLRMQRMDMSNDQLNSILSSLQLSESQANRILGDPQLDDLAILALSVAGGVRRDYDALVLHQWMSSLARAQEVNLLGRKLLKANPGAHDAYCIFGWSEYLISLVPAVFRPLVKIPGITGNRQKAIQFCRVASRTGSYYRDFALCLLVALYDDEQNPEEALRVLSRLATEFPGNSTIAAELIRRRADAAG